VHQVEDRAEVHRLPSGRPPQGGDRPPLAFDVAAGRMNERAFLAAMRRLNEEHAALTDHLPRKSVDGGRAVEYIRTFAASWAKAKPPTRATMIQSVYEEIVVRGEEFVSIRLTPEAYAHGLALALPAEVVVPALPTWGGPRRGSNMALARPTGVGRAIPIARPPGSRRRRGHQQSSASGPGRERCSPTPASWSASPWRSG
jgi:hypothetical protein